MTFVATFGSSAASWSSRPSASRRRVQRRLRDRREHPGHRADDPRLAEELVLPLEDGRVVVVEADDHPGIDLQPRLLHLANPVDDAAAHVLILLRLAERLLVGALDADEDGDQARLGHQPQQLVVLGQVERRLGEEGERVAVPRAASR